MYFPWCPIVFLSLWLLFICFSFLVIFFWSFHSILCVPMKTSLSFSFLDLCFYSCITCVCACACACIYFWLVLVQRSKDRSVTSCICASRSGGLGCCFFLLSFILHFVLSLKWTFCGVPFYYCLSFIFHLSFFIRWTLCGVSFYRITALNGLQQISLHHALQVILENILHPEFSLKIRMLFTPISKSRFRSPVLKSIPSNVS